MVPTLDDNYPIDSGDHAGRAIMAAATGLPDTKALPALRDGAVIADDEPVELTSLQFQQLAIEAESQASTFMDTSVRQHWSRNYRASRNEHSSTSKYMSAEFRGRSRLFRPKTFSAIRKAMANAARALFASGNVVGVTAENEADPKQRASAAIKQELINYRLDRKSKRNGIRWFEVAMGARRDSYITGICVSKQTWKYREENGKRVEDRPDIDLIPPENVLFDGNCNWINPAQSTAYLSIRNPMNVGDAMSFIRAGRKSGAILFRDNLTEDWLLSNGRTGGASDTLASRTARSGGSDPVQQLGGTKWAPVWLHEVFMRVNGVDYVFWMIAGRLIISEPMLVSEAYPAHAGERPIVIGYGTLESHKPYPMSQVEALQPLQQEINDSANLRLDHMKKTLDPPTIVKRGKKIDLDQVHRSGPNKTIMVNDADDVQFPNLPATPQAAFVENNYLNADFDDTAGSFNGGSVQTNRSMNETVGGMKILANDSQTMGEFDLSVWTETWVEPVIWQVMKLIEMYEDDETVLIIAGERARVYDKFGVNDITDEMLKQESSLKVSIGVGASMEPMERLQKLGTAFQLTSSILGPLIAAKVIPPVVTNTREIIDTIFGNANFPDAAERFFVGLKDAVPGQMPMPPQGPQGPPPDPAKEAMAQAKMQQNQIAAEKNQTDAQLESQRIQNDLQEALAQLQIQKDQLQLDRDKLQMENNHFQQELADNERQRRHDADQARRDRYSQTLQGLMSHNTTMAAGKQRASQGKAAGK